MNKIKKSSFYLLFLIDLFIFISSIILMSTHDIISKIGDKEAKNYMPARWLFVTILINFCKFITTSFSIYLKKYPLIILRIFFFGIFDIILMGYYFSINDEVNILESFGWTNLTFLIGYYANLIILFLVPFILCSVIIFTIFASPFKLLIHFTQSQHSQPFTQSQHSQPFTQSQHSQPLNNRIEHTHQLNNVYISTECKICFSTNVPFMLLSPCGHIFCKDCSVNLNHCGICRSNIQSKIPIIS